MRKVLALLLLTVACGTAPVPVVLDPRSDTCTSCRMVISAQHFASQIVAPYEEPRFFDDMGCLQRYLERTPLPAGAVIFVADHRTGEWIPSTTAVFSRVESLTAPMGSHIIAHASRGSRTADAEAAGAVDVDRETVFGHVRTAGSSR
jgi:copper chaperone NosL